MKNVIEICPYDRLLNVCVKTVNTMAADDQRMPLCIKPAHQKFIQSH